MTVVEEMGVIGVLEESRLGIIVANSNVISENDGLYLPSPSLKNKDVGFFDNLGPFVPLS